MAADTRLDHLCINTIRFLAVDAVEKAKSGHPGAPMGAAPMAYVLWDRFLKHNPRNPAWFDRDRFLLSAGHASMLLYALLHLTGYDLPMEELQRFRQWGSKTPGHPESVLTPGVELTTGPLGQGFANGVGMAIAEAWLGSRYNRPSHELINHYTYALASDGDLQEGVSAEAASLAGTLKLGKLIYLYDDNGIQIEGSTDPCFMEDVGKRFDAYGWQVLGPVDGNDLGGIHAAIAEAQTDTARPSLIICQSIIGYGSPMQNTGKVHGEPLGEDNVRAAKEKLGWPQEPTFHVPDEVAAHMRQAVERGSDSEEAWQQKLAAYRREYPEEAREFEAQSRGELAPGWDEGLQNLFPPDSKPLATRSAFGVALNALASRVSNLMGGAGDLAPSTKTIMEGAGDFLGDDHSGRNMRFGVREHAMGSIAVGMALHGGVIPYTATFLAFADYMRPPMRLAAMSEARVIFNFSHDSIGVGEDGPTHEPIEQMMNLRAVPKLTVIRPADANETAEALRAGLANADGPTVIITSRQNLPVLDQKKYAPAEGLRRGGYVLWQSGDGTPEVVLIGTGSEVHVCLEAAEKLAADGINARVVSLPSWELFNGQPADYRESVLPGAVKARVAVEAGIALGWEHYVGCEGAIVGMTTFGASAPGKTVFEKFGFTPEHVAEVAKGLGHPAARRRQRRSARSS
ncbi:MAG: transketolase [Armatimonadota bacterium]|nr:MAG: transketolase [Armatimonadota bacterium]